MTDLIIGTVWTGDKFDERYPRNLHAMLRRFVKRDFLFFLITDRAVWKYNEKENVPILLPNRAGLYPWWNFMLYYSDFNNPLYNTCKRIYFGLDTVIRDDITRITEREEYTLSLDFNYLIGNPARMFAGTWADCAAVIPKGGMPWLYEEFMKEHKETGIGSSDYPMHVWVTHKLIERNVQPAIWQNIDSEILCSYKWPSPKIDEPKEPMVFFHGEPMIHETIGQSPWIDKYWKSKI